MLTGGRLQKWHSGRGILRIKAHMTIKTISLKILLNPSSIPSSYSFFFICCHIARPLTFFNWFEGRFFFHVHLYLTKICLNWFFFISKIATYAFQNFLDFLGEIPLGYIYALRQENQQNHSITISHVFINFDPPRGLGWVYFNSF